MHPDRELIGSGRLGEVWRTRDAAGHLVALRPLETGHEEVRRRAALLRALPSDHLVRVRSVADRAVLLDLVPGGSLADLGALTPGQVVTAVAPIAVALGEAHRLGLAHGRLSAREVLLTPGGKPRLDGLPLSFLHDPAAEPDEDVRALGRLAQDLLAGPAPSAMTQAVTLALGAGGTATGFGEALLRSCRAEPLAGSGLPDPPVLVRFAAPTAEPAARRRRWLLPLVIVPAVVAGALASRGTPAPAPTDWRAVLDALDRSRAEAFAAGDPTVLERVYVTGSAALAADRLALSRLLGARLTARGLSHDVSAVTVTREAADRVELAVREHLSAYVLVTRAGEASRRPAAPDEMRVIVLRRTPEGWRVESTCT